MGLPPQVAQHLPLDPAAWNLNVATVPVLVYMVVYCGELLSSQAVTNHEPLGTT